MKRHHTALIVALLLVFSAAQIWAADRLAESARAMFEAGR